MPDPVGITISLCGTDTKKALWDIYVNSLLIDHLRDQFPSGNGNYLAGPFFFNDSTSHTDFHKYKSPTYIHFLSVMIQLPHIL